MSVVNLIQITPSYVNISNKTTKKQIARSRSEGGFCVNHEEKTRRPQNIVGSRFYYDIRLKNVDLEMIHT